MFGFALSDAALDAFKTCLLPEWHLRDYCYGCKKYFLTVKKNEECGLRVILTTLIDYCDSSWTFLCLKDLNSLGTSPQKQARIKYVLKYSEQNFLFHMRSLAIVI